MTYLAGDPLPASDLNFPICHLRQTLTQSIPSSTDTALTFNVEDVDTHGGHSTASLTSRYTAQREGWYLLSGGVSFEGNGNGLRALSWRRSGALLSGGSVITNTPGAVVDSRIVARTLLVFLTVGQYVELIAFQNSGTSLNTVVSGIEQPHMSVMFVREV